MEQEQSTSPSRSLDRVGQVLEYLTQSGTGYTLTELQDYTAIPRSSLYTLLGSLIDQEMVKRESGGKFIAGRALIRWGARLIQRLDLRDVARPWMARLAQQTGFVVNLAELDADHKDIVFVAKEQSQRFPTTSEVGTHLLLHSTASGKVFLANATMEWRGRYLSGPLVARTPATRTDPVLLTEELEQIRKQGWSEDHEENEIGVCAIAAPIRNYTGRVAATLSVAWPSEYIEEYRHSIIETTMSTARLISRELGAEG